ncbi:MAG: hypothetical protein LUO93_10670 [Methanomicrobiales archaeon]|nr:hypothetical protein [Methanomicrobiales archaeon]
MSLVILFLLVTGRITPRHLKVYGIMFLVVLLFSAGMKIYVSGTSAGKTIPTLNPFSWLVIEENETAYRIEEYGVFYGVTNETVFEKYRNIISGEAGWYLTRPDLQRLTYFSYLVIVEKNSTAITFHDPIRERQMIWYPPYYHTVTLPTQTS